MGKHSGKNKKSLVDKPSESNYDKDTAVFVSMSQELKDEGNKLFQKRDYEGAMLKYEKAIRLLPRSHIDVSYLRSNMAACYMQLGIIEYPRAIHECNLALEVTPKYSKALLKRARCYEALNRLDLARRDVGIVLKMEPSNLMAIEIAERVNETIEKRGSRENENPIDLVALPQSQLPKEKVGKKKSNIEKEMKIKNEENKFNIEKSNTEDKALMEEAKIDEGKIEEIKEKKGRDDKDLKIKNEENKFNIEEIKEKKGKDEKDLKIENEEKKFNIEENKTEDKVVVDEEKIVNGIEEEPRRTVKLVFGEDIRWAKIPFNCDILKVREIIYDRFPSSMAVLVKYKDQEGDLMTITTTEELRLAELSAEHGFVKLYIVEVNPDQDPLFEKIKKDENVIENGSVCITDWIIEFAKFFKSHVGFDIDAYLDLHEVGMKRYSDAMEEMVTSEEAQELFDIAEEKFREMVALALFNWGNVHMARARKRVYFADECSNDSIIERVKCAYDWAQTEYKKAGKKYEEALKMKPDFYEAALALGQQQFEQAKLSWYYAIGSDVDLKMWPSSEAIHLYNNAEENMEKGMKMWEEMEEKRVDELCKKNKFENVLQKMKLLKCVSVDEENERAANVWSQIHVLWGTMLYERSIMEFKLGLPVWRECLEVAVEKFELAGASPTDIAVMIKNHCSNDTASEGLGFNIDEIVQAWNEMYEAKMWQSSIRSFRLEPLLKRRVSKLYDALGHA